VTNQIRDSRLPKLVLFSSFRKRHFSVRVENVISRIAVAILCCAGLLSAQESTSQDYAAFAQVKQAIQAMVRKGQYTGFDEKQLNRAGDLAAVVILKTFSDTDLENPEILRSVLLVVRQAWVCPARCVSGGNRQPRITLLLLDRLRGSSKGKLKSEVERTTRYVVQQAMSQ